MDQLQLSHPSVGTIHVTAVDVERTLLLRQAVLRPHQRLDEIDLPGSEHPEAVAIGAVAASSGEVVGTAAVSPEEAPEDLAAVIPPGRRWRLRSMATRPDLRSSGIGAVVIQAVIDYVAHHGGGVLWCNARTGAIRFYERAGFVTFGEPWIAEAIGPHVMMWTSVARAKEKGSDDE
ncbi:MAG: GNAT family N-acetyltransferase [Acidimicrobiales bacterium]